MQSWWMQMTDTDTVLELRDTPQPEPGPQQLLVRMRAASLNRGEFLLGHGLHGQPGSWKAIGGECAGGIVIAGIVCRDRIASRLQRRRDCRTNAARAAGHKGHFRHFFPL